MTYVPYQRCTRNGPYVEVEVQSESDPKTIYVVLITDPTAVEEAICDCRAFRFSLDGTCKHQQIAIDSLCHWNDLEGPEQQVGSQRRNKVCPRCGYDTEWRAQDA